MWGVKINQDMDIDIEDGDVVIDESPETAIRLALSTSNHWWGVEGGGEVYDLLCRGKLSNDLVLKVKQKAITDLKFLNDEVDGYSVEVSHSGSQMNIEVTVNDKEKKNKWTFQQ